MSVATPSFDSLRSVRACCLEGCILTIVFVSRLGVHPFLFICTCIRHMYKHMYTYTFIHTPMYTDVSIYLLVYVLLSKNICAYMCNYY